MGGEELKWSQLAHHQLMSQQRNHFSTHSKLKPMIKHAISGRKVSNGISDIAFASVYSEKPPEEVLYYDNNYEYITRNDVFGGHQKLTSTMKLRPEQ